MQGLAMHAHRSRAVFRRHFVWLLWLALLPAAQATASSHALSHAMLDAGSAGGAKHARRRSALHIASIERPLSADPGSAAFSRVPSTAGLLMLDSGATVSVCERAATSAGCARPLESGELA